MKRDFYRLFTVMWMAVVLSACGVLGLQKPQNFGDYWEYSQRKSIALRQAAATSLDNGTIDVATAKWVREVADKADDGLDLARAAHAAGDFRTAETRLELAILILTEIERELANRSAPK